MKKTNFTALKALKNDVIEVAMTYKNLEEFERKTALSRDCYSSYYCSMVNDRQEIFSVMNQTEAMDEDTENSCVFAICLLYEDGDGDVIFECDEDDVYKVSEIICSWIEEAQERKEKFTHELEVMKDFYSWHPKYLKKTTSITWTEWKDYNEIPQYLTINQMLKRCKNLKIASIGMDE